MSFGSGRGNGHVTPCEPCPLRKRDEPARIHAEELAFVQEFKIDELRVEPGASFLREGARSEHLYTVLSAGRSATRCSTTAAARSSTTRCPPTWSACRAR